MYSISLQTSKPVVTADDIIGIVNFAASNEEDRRDSIFVGATISAIAEGPFTQVSNPTSLVFTTSDSGPANEQVRITSVGNVGIGNPSPQYKLDVKGELNILPYNVDHTIRIGRASGKASIRAEGTEAKDKWLIMDSNGSPCVLNYFTSDNVLLAYGGGGVSVGTTNPGSHKFRVVGGTTAIDGGHFTFNDDGGNFDFRVEGDTDPNLIFADASTDNVGIGTISPAYKLDVNGDARILGIRPTIISAGSSYATTKQASVGGWSFGHHALGSSGTDLGGFGWFGTDDAITRYYMGPDYLSTDGIHITSLGNIGVGTPSPETKVDVQVSAMLDGIRVSGPLLPSVQIISTGDDSSHAIIGNNQGQLTIAADMTSVGGAASALQLGVKGETVVKITDAKAEVVDGTLAANTVNLGPSSTRHFSIYRDTGGTFGSSIIQDTLGDIKIIAGSAEAIKIMNDSAGGTGGVRIYDNYTLPIDDGSAGYVLKTDGNGNVTWQLDNSSTGGGGTVAGTGTAGYNARWSNSTTLTDGIIQDNGSQVSVKTTITGRALTVGGTTDSNSAILIQGTGVPAGNSSRGFLVSSYGNGDSYLWSFENRPMIFATSNAEAMRIGSDGSLQHSGGTAAIIGGQSAYHIDVTADETTIGGGRFQVKAGETVVNEGGGSVDFRVEGNTSAYLLNVDGSEDRVGIGTSTPAYKLDVTNNARVGDIIIGDTVYSASSSYQGITHDTWSGITQAYMMISDGNDTLIGSQRNTIIRCNENDGGSQMQITPIFTQIRQDNNYVAFRTGSTKFNENSNNVDFMVHGDTKLNMIYVDASADKVAIGTSTPTETLTVSGGLENLGGWKWYSGSTSTTGQGPANGFVLKLNDQYGTVLSKAFHYIVRLTCTGTGTRSGASFLVYYEPTFDPPWQVRPISQSHDVSNHPNIQVEDTGTNDIIKVFTDNASPYPIQHTVESFLNNELDASPHSMGSDYHWQRYINNLHYDDGNVGIGIKVPALQSAGKGLHINSDGVHSEIKLTNTVTGSGAGDGTALVASNSSFTINNREAGEVNINTNNLNAISINSAREVDIKQLLKVRLSNSVGAAGTVNRISYYDDGAGTKTGVGVSSGNVDYVATGGIIQSFYTGGVRNLRLDPSGKVVMGAGSNVVAGDASLNYNVGICTNAATNAAIQVLKVVPDDGPSTFFNQYNRLTVPSGNPTAVRGIYQDMIIQDGADLANIYGYTVGTNTVNAGGNVDTVIGYYVNNVFLRGSASNYGIYSDVNEEETGYADKWGLFLAGTAPNYYRSGLKTSLIEGRHGSDNLCERVAGGYKALGNTSTNAGYLKIRLPEYLPEQKAGSTMLMFDVSVYEYKTGGYKNFHLGGYVYWNTSSQVSQWINTTATMEVDRDIDNANPWVVRFAVDEDDYPCVLIGRSGENEATNWAYGQVYLQNVRTGFGRTTWNQWSQNWEISLETRNTTTGGYYNISSGFINKPLMHNQVDYSITAGGTDISSPSLNKIIIDGNKTVFNENGVNTDFRVESDANQHMIFVDASADVVGIGLSNPRSDAILHVGGPSSQNPTLMIGTGSNISGSTCSLKFQDRGPAQDQDADGQITGYVQMERDGNSQNFDMTFGTVNTTAGDAVERMRIDKDGLVGIGTNAPSKLLHVDNSGRGSGTSFLIQGDDDSYMSVQNSTSGDFLKLGNVYTSNGYMGLSHGGINNNGYMIMSDGSHTFVSANTSGRLYLRGGRNDGNQGEIRVGDGMVQVNPSALNTDFRVCGDSVAELLRVDASKDAIYIGNSSDGGVNSRLYIYDDGTAKTNVANSRTLQVQGRAYTTVSGTHYHIGMLSRAEKWLSGGATDAGYCIGINAVPVVYSNSDDGANSLTEITAVRANMSINSSLADGVNVTNAYDVKCIPSLAGTNSTVTNHYGIYLTSATNGATTVTNAYGVFQEDDDASNRFAGDMTIGSTAAPDSFDGLTVYGNISSKRTDGKIMAKDAAVVTKLQASVGAGGGIVGTESNHNLLIRSNNADVARFDVNGNFQVRKGMPSFSVQTEVATDLYGGLYVQAPDIADSYIARFEGFQYASAGYNIDQVKDLRINTLGGITLQFRSNPTVNDPTLAIRNGITFNPDNIQFNNYSGFRDASVETFKVNTDTGAVTINQSYTLPTADGTNGQVLTTDGNGQVSWAAGGGSGGGAAAGSGAITGCKLGNWQGGPAVPVNVAFTNNTTSSSPAYVPMGPKVYWATPKFALTNDSTVFVFDDGVYTIDVSIQWKNNGANRATAAAAIEINGEIYFGSLDYSYSRGNIYNQLGALQLSMTEVLSANDTIRVAIWVQDADAADVVETEITRTTIMKIADSISPS